MKHMYDSTHAEELKGRLRQLRQESPRQWGTMSPPQAVAHCAVGMEMALGDFAPPRMMIGRVLGWLIKPLALGNDAPMRRNSPTVPQMVIGDQRDLEKERQRLIALIDRFTTGGPSAASTHPHGFFGPMTPNEWAVLMYKHVDHHLRQFGV